MQYPSNPNLLYEPEYERSLGSTPSGTFVVGGRSKNPVQQANPPEPTQADRDAFYVNSNDTFVQTRMGGSIVPPEFGPEKPVPPDVMKDILEKMGDRYDPMSNEKFSDQWQRLGITDPLKNQNLQDIAQGIYNSQLLKDRYDAGQRGLNLFDPGYEKRFGSTPPGAFVVGGSSWERTPEELKAEYEQNVRNTAMSGANLLQDLASYSPTGQSGYGDFYTRAQADPSLLRKFHGESDEDALMRLKYNVMDAEQRKAGREAAREQVDTNIAKWNIPFTISGLQYGTDMTDPYNSVGLQGALENMRRIQGLNPQYQDMDEMISAITGKTVPTATVGGDQTQTTGTTQGGLDQASAGATDAAQTNLGTIRDYEGKEYDASTILNLAKQIAPLIDTKGSSGAAFGTKGQSIGFNYDEAKRLLGGDVSSAQQVLLDMARSLMSQGVTDISQLTAREYEEPGAAIDEGATQFAPGTKKMGVFAGETMLPEQFGRTFTGKGATGYNVRIDPQTGKPVFSTSGYSTSDRGAIAPLLMMANMALPGVGTALSGGLASLAPGALAAGSLANQALTNAIISGSLSKLSGGDFGKGFIRGGLTPVVGAGVGSMIPADFAAANPQLANALRNIGTGAITAGLTGGDIGQALTSGITNAAINAGMNATLGQIPGYTDLSPSAKAAVNQIVGTAIRGGKQDPIRIAMAAINAQIAADAEKARKAKKPGGLASGGAVPGYYDGGDVDYDDYNFDMPETVIDPTVFPDFLIPQEEEEPSFNMTVVDKKFPFADLEAEYSAYGPIESDVPEETPENTFVPPDLSECRAGEVRDEDGNCVNVASRDTCPPGTHVDEEGECVADPEPEDPTQCPEGYLYNFETQQCELIPTDPLECPPGYVYSDSEQACVKITTPPRPTTPTPPKPPTTPTGGGTTRIGGSQTNVNIPPVQQLSPLVLQALRTEGGGGGYQDPLAGLKELVSGMRPTSAPTYKMDPYLESLVNQPSKTGYFTYGREPSMDEVLSMSRGFADGGEVDSDHDMAAPLMAGGGRYIEGREDFRDGKHVAGPGDGQSDDIPAWLADGEFVFPADVVAALGNGSTKAGTDKLYDMMHSIRKYHRSADPEDLPPEAKKSPLDYLSKGKKGAKA